MTITTRSVIISTFLSLCLAIGGGFAAALFAGEAPPGGGTPPPNDTKKRLNNTICTCDQLSASITKEPSPYTDPKCGTPGAAVQPNSPGAHGPGNTDLLWEVTITGPNDECCKKAKTGIIQNLVSYVNKATYDGGGQLRREPTTPAGTFTLAMLPLLDATPTSPSPYYSNNSVGYPTACGTPVPLKFADYPTVIVWPLVLAGQNIATITRRQTYRICVVWECPVGTIIPLKSYDWELRVDITFGPMPGGGYGLTSYSACAEEVGTGAVAPVAGGDTAAAATNHGDSVSDVGF